MMRPGATWSGKTVKTARELAASAAILLAIAGCSSGTEVFDVEDASETAAADWDFTIPEGAGEALSLIHI